MARGRRGIRAATCRRRLAGERVEAELVGTAMQDEGIGGQRWVVATVAHRELRVMVEGGSDGTASAMVGTRRHGRHGFRGVDAGMATQEGAGVVCCGSGG